MIYMLCVKSRRLIDYLWERGYIPAFETAAGAYYMLSQDLYMLLDNYYIHYYCIPNKKEL